MYLYKVSVFVYRINQIEIMSFYVLMFSQSYYLMDPFSLRRVIGAWDYVRSPFLEWTQLGN